MTLLSPLAAAIRRVPTPGQAVLCMVLATLAFALMHAMIRHATRDLHPFEVGFFRAFFGFLALAPVFIRRGLAPLRTSRWRLHVGRVFINAVAMLSFFYALSITPLAEATALGFTAPLFATLLAMAIYGERVRWRRWSAILAGFAGALVIIRPGFIEVGLGPLLVVFSSAVWACALMIVKSLARTESSVTITAYLSLVLSPITLAVAWPHWTWPSLEQYLWLALIGIAGTVAQTALNQAMKMADASVVLPIDFVRLIWATALGYALFAEVPDLWTWVGGAVIFASATYIGIRESRLRRAGMAP